MTTRTNIGKSVYYSPALPATNDAAGFEALTWTEIPGVQVAPQLGIEHSSIEVPDLKTGFTSGVKGAGKGVETQLACRIIASDSAQAAVKALADGPTGECSIKIGTGSGTDNALQTDDPVQYAQGYLHSYKEIQIDTTTHEGFTVAFRQNDVTVNDTEPA